jgi:hypothetical protein
MKHQFQGGAPGRELLELLAAFNPTGLPGGSAAASPAAAAEGEAVGDSGTEPAATENLLGFLPQAARTLLPAGNLVQCSVMLVLRLAASRRPTIRWHVCPSCGQSTCLNIAPTPVPQLPPAEVRRAVQAQHRCAAARCCCY